MKDIAVVTRRINLEWRLAVRRMQSRHDGMLNADGIRWGVIGPGGMGEEFASAIAREGAGRVSAVYSRSLERAQRFARRHAALAAYDDLDGMLRAERDRLDLIYIATPADTHYDLVRRCVSEGYSVLCEKPLVPTLSEAQKLFDLAASKDLMLFEGMWMRCLPTHTQAHSWLSSGHIGTMQSVHASILKPVPGPEKSALMDFGAYAISFVGDLVAPGPMTLSIARDDDDDGVDRDWTIDASDGAGVRFSVSLSNRRGGLSGARIDGTDGAIEFAPQFNRTNHVTLMDTSGRVRTDNKYKYSSAGLEHELEAVTSAVRDGSSSLLTPSRSLRAAKLMEAIAGVPAGRKELSIVF